MAMQVDEAGGRVLRTRIGELGVGIHTGKQTTEIVDAQGGAHRICFADGSELEADLIVFSAGIRPRDELARAAGLDVGERGGVVIDGDCRTSDPSIYAIGECALFGGKLFGLVAPGYQMAAIAAAHVLGAPAGAFTGADMSTKLKLLGVDVASIGDAHAATAGARCCSYTDERRQVYKKLVVSADGTRLLGGILVGSADEYGTLLSMVQNDLPLPADPEHLIFPAAAAGAKPQIGVGGLPDTAQICSCNGVSKGDLCAAVTAGDDIRRAEAAHQGSELLRRLRRTGDAGLESGARTRRRCRQQSSLRTLSLLPTGAIPLGAHRRPANLRRGHAQAWSRTRLRHMQARRGIDSGLLLE